MILKEQDIIRLINDEIRLQNLKKEVNKIEITTTNFGGTKFLAGYNEKEKIIILNYKEIISNTKEYYNDEDEINFLITYIVFHELQHANQYKIVKSFMPSTEKEILKNDFLVIEKYYAYYLENNDLFPSEYNAKVIGYKKALQKNNLIKFKKELKNIINDYYKYNSFRKFYENINALNKYEKIIKSNLTNQKRIEYGLPRK